MEMKTQLFVQLKNEEDGETYVGHFTEDGQVLGEKLRDVTMRKIFDTFSRVAQIEKREQKPKLYQKLSDGQR